MRAVADAEVRAGSDTSNDASNLFEPLCPPHNEAGIGADGIGADVDQQCRVAEALAQSSVNSQTYLV